MRSRPEPTRRGEVSTQSTSRTRRRSHPSRALGLVLAHRTAADVSIGQHGGQPLHHVAGAGVRAVHQHLSPACSFLAHQINERPLLRVHDAFGQGGRSGDEVPALGIAHRIAPPGSVGPVQQGLQVAAQQLHVAATIRTADLAAQVSEELPVRVGLLRRHRHLHGELPVGRKIHAQVGQVQKARAVQQAREDCRRHARQLAAAGARGAPLGLLAAAAYDDFLKLLARALHESVLLHERSQAETHRETIRREIRQRCRDLAWQCADMLRSADEVEFLEDTLDVTLSPHFRTAIERYDATGRLLDRMGKKVNPRYAKKIREISNANLQALGRGVRSNAPGATSLLSVELPTPAPAGDFGPTPEGEKP